jgi:hypothetical protein
MGDRAAGSSCPSNVKIGAAGTMIDVPLGHKDEAWSFDHSTR